MDFNKAKNITILFLVILNVFLLGLNLRSYYTRRLSGDEIDNIKTVLASKGITVSGDIPKDSGDLPQLEIRRESYDLFVLSDIFFGKGAEVSRTEEFDVTIFKSKGKTLRVDGSKLSFSDPNVMISEETDAEKRADIVVNRLNEVFYDFTFEKTISTEDGIKVLYNMYYKNYNCFNSYCIFTFNDKGMNVEINYAIPTGFSGVKSDVYSADIVLFSFMNEIKDKYPGESIDISHISLGYLDVSGNETDSAEAIPCYSISLEGKSERFYINGYTAAYVEDFNK